MLSYWLDETGQLNKVSDYLAALAQRGVELTIDHSEDVWVIPVLCRPKWVYHTLDELKDAGQSETAAKHIESLWFVMDGDQWIFTAESKDELRPFLAGMLATFLLRPDQPVS